MTRVPADRLWAAVDSDGTLHIGIDGPEGEVLQIGPGVDITLEQIRLRCLLRRVDEALAYAALGRDTAPDKPWWPVVSVYAQGYGSNSGPG